MLDGCDGCSPECLRNVNVVGMCSALGKLAEHSLLWGEDHICRVVQKTLGWATLPNSRDAWRTHVAAGHSLGPPMEGL